MYSDCLFCFQFRNSDFKWPCTICGQSYSSKGNLKRHIDSHAGKYPYKCNLCDFGSTNPNNLKAHMTVHTGINYFKCEGCGHSFRSKRVLQKHQTKPGECQGTISQANGGHLEGSHAEANPNEPNNPEGSLTEGNNAEGNNHEGGGENEANTSEEIDNDENASLPIKSEHAIPPGDKPETSIRNQQVSPEGNYMGNYSQGYHGSFYKGQECNNSVSGEGHMENVYLAGSRDVLPSARSLPDFTHPDHVI